MKRLFRWISSLFFRLGKVKVKPIKITQVSVSMFGDVFGLGDDGLTYYWEISHTAGPGNWTEYRYSTYLTREKEITELLGIAKIALNQQIGINEKRANK